MLDNFDEIDTEAHGGNKDGNISRADLLAVIRDPSSNPHLRVVAQRVLSDPSYRQGLNSKDDLFALSISKESLNTSQENDQKVSDTATLLLDNFDSAEIKSKGGDLDGKLSVGDLRALIADPSISPEHRQAAQVLIDEAPKSSPFGIASSKFIFKEADLEKLFH